MGKESKASAGPRKRRILLETSLCMAPSFPGDLIYRTSRVILGLSWKLSGPGSVFPLETQSSESFAGPGLSWVHCVHACERFDSFPHLLFFHLESSLLALFPQREPSPLPHWVSLLSCLSQQKSFLKSYVSVVDASSIWLFRLLDQDLPVEKGPRLLLASCLGLLGLKGRLPFLRDN